MVDREASSYNTATLQKWRQSREEDLAERERVRSQSHFERTLAWLDCKQRYQEDALDSLRDKCYADTADWIIQHQKVASWIGDVDRHDTLWIHGIPGSGRLQIPFLSSTLTIVGKSVLSSKLIDHLHQGGGLAVAYYICKYQPTADLDSCSDMLRSIATQLVKQKPELAAYVHDEYIQKGEPESKKTMRSLIPALVTAFSRTRIIIDGIDELVDTKQKEMLSILKTLTDGIPNGTTCKFAIFSRDIPLIRKAQRKQPHINLRDERHDTDSSIRTYVQHEMQLLRLDLHDSMLPDGFMDEIESKLVLKADGTSAGHPQLTALTIYQACFSGSD